MLDPEEKTLKQTLMLVDQALEYANEKFARDLIPVVDALDMAISATKNADLASEDLLEKLKEGIELTMKQFLTTLEKHGVTAVSHEEEFDPNIHNGIQIQRPPASRCDGRRRRLNLERYLE